MLWIIPVGVAILGFAGIRTVNQEYRGYIERFGKAKKFAEPGFHWIIPIVDHMRKVKITEQMVDAKRQEVITGDNLNASVDAQVYFRIKPLEKSVWASQYDVDDVEWQIVNLAKTTLRDIIGKMSFKTVNSERDKINKDLMKTLETETASWGIQIVRTELKEIEPPEKVQASMNQVVIAENDKVAAKDFATAEETRGDGVSRKMIKEAQGKRESAILEAEGEAKAIITVAEANAKRIEVVNKAAQKWFKGNAEKLKRLEVTQASLEDNSKIIITEKGISPTIVIDDGGKKIIPIKK